LNPAGGGRYAVSCETVADFKQMIIRCRCAVEICIMSSLSFGGADWCNKLFQLRMSSGLGTF